MASVELTVTSIPLNGGVDVLANQKNVKSPNAGFFRADYDANLCILFTGVGSSPASVSFRAGEGPCGAIGDEVVVIPTNGKVAVCLESSRFMDKIGYISFNLTAGEVAIEVIRLPLGL